MISSEDKLKVRNVSFKTHRRSKTFPVIYPYFRINSNYNKKRIISDSNVLKKSFTFLLILSIMTIILIDVLFRRFGGLKIFDRVVNNSSNMEITEGEFTFEYLNKIFDELDILNLKKVSLFQKNDGISVISNKNILKNTTIIEIDSEMILYTRDEYKDNLNRRISKDIEKGIINDVVGLMVLLLKHKKMSVESPLYKIIRSLPSVQWFKNNGIFSMNKKDFEVASHGTTMEGIYDIIEKYCKLATSYIYSTIIKRELGISHSVDYLNGAPITQFDIQWSYMIVRSYSIKINNGLGFIPSLIFIRKSNSNSSIDIVMDIINMNNTNHLDINNDTINRNEYKYNEYNRYNVRLVSKKHILKGDEILFQDNKSLTDSEIFINRGQWLVSSHKMIIPVIFPIDILNSRINNDDNEQNNAMQLSISQLYINNTSSSDTVLNDNITNIILKKFDCSLNLMHYFYFEEENAINYNFIFCLRLFSYIKYNSKKNLLNIDPYLILRPLNRKIEIEAASIGISIIQNRIDKLRSSAINVINHFGDRSVHQLPVIKVREAEMIILRNIIKYLHNWYYIVNDIDTYESYYYNLLSLY